MKCPTCDREDCPMLSEHEHSDDRRPGCVAQDDCRAHRVDWRARAQRAEAALTSTLGPENRMIVDSLLDLKRIRDLEAQVQRAEDRVAALEAELIDYGETPNVRGAVLYTERRTIERVVAWLRKRADRQYEIDGRAGWTSGASEALRYLADDVEAGAWRDSDV